MVKVLRSCLPMLVVWSVEPRAFGADSLPIKLEYAAPAECGDRAALESEVRSMLGEASIPTGRPPLEAEVELRPAPDGKWEASLATWSDEGRRQRTLRTDSCEEARRAIALLLALMLDPHARPEASAHSSIEERRQPPAPPPAARRPPRAAPRERRPTEMLIGLGGVADWGTLPAWGYGGRLNLGVAIERWTVEASIAAWLPRSARSAQLRGAGGRFTLLEGRIGPCVQSSRSAIFSVEGCAGPMFLWMRAAGFGVTDPAEATALWPALFAEAALLGRASRSVAARLAVGGLVPLARPTFALRDVGPVHRPSAVAGRGEVGVEVLF